MKGYKIDFAKNTITMNYKFAAAAATRGTPEYEEIKEIRADFPDLAVVTLPGRRPPKNPSANKRLTYANMERHIREYPNAEELLSNFEKVKALSAPLASPYKYVCDWFKAQFPHYKDASKTVNDAVFAMTPVAPPAIEGYKIAKAS